MTVSNENKEVYVTERDDKQEQLCGHYKTPAPISFFFEWPHGTVAAGQGGNCNGGNKRVSMQKKRIGK